MHAVAAMSYARTHTRSSALGARGAHVFLISVAVFLVLNVAENLVHYSIGRRRQRQQQLDDDAASPRADARQGDGWWPTPRDAATIAAVMLVFAALQGTMTWALLG